MDAEVVKMPLRPRDWAANAEEEFERYYGDLLPDSVIVISAVLWNELRLPAAEAQRVARLVYAALDWTNPNVTVNHR